jgi:hypothetical protein
MTREQKVTDTGSIKEYNRAQFEGAYRSLVQMIHALAYIDIEEVKRWVQKVTDEDSAAAGTPLTEPQKEGRDRILQLFTNMQEFKETLKETGVPPIPAVNVQRPPQ